MRAATTVALALCAAALFAGTAYAVPIARDRTSHQHRLQQRVQRSQRTATTAAGASDAEADADADAAAQWIPVFPDDVGGLNMRIAFDFDLDPKVTVPKPDPLPAKLKESVAATRTRPLGAAVYVFNDFKDTDRTIGTGESHTASKTAPGLTPTNVLAYLQADTTHFPGGELTVGALDAWFTKLSGEGVAPTGTRTTHNRHDLAGDAAPVSKALFNAMWTMFGSPVAHWGIAVARYRFAGRQNVKYDVYWIAGADNTALGQGQAVEHTEYRILTALQAFENTFLLANGLVDASASEVPVDASKFTDRHINWVLLFRPCGDANRGCDYHIAHFDGRTPDPKDLKNPLANVESKCPAAKNKVAASHVVYFKDPAVDNSVVQP